MSKIKIIPLGGVEEIGINSTAIEYNNEIAIIDMGLGFPLSDQYGVDYVIPNTDYLKKNKHKNQGLIITHAHLDHIGAIPFVLKDLGFPVIFASQFAAELISAKLIEYNLMSQARIQIINFKSELASGDFKISFFKVNHSIPESMGVIVKTPAGTIVHTGDFKFDNSPVNEEVADYAKIADTGANGVLALLSDSTNSFKTGHSKSEAVISNVLENIVEKAKGRVIVATFSSLVNRLYQLLQIAEQTNRKVLIVGKSMQNMIEFARKIGYIDVKDSLFISERAVKRLKDENVMILATGAQGEHFAALARIARGEHAAVKIRKGDTIILSASIIPGNDMLVQGMIDEFSRQGAHVFHNAEIMDLHSSGHGYQEDQRLMINLVKPKFFMPVHGYPSFLYKHASIAQELGIPEKNTIIANRGDVIELDQNSWAKAGKVKAQPVLVSGSGVGDVGNVVLADREQLANYGVIVINLNIKDNLLNGNAHIVSRGFVYVKDNRAMMEKIASIAEAQTKEGLLQKKDDKTIREGISSAVRKFVFGETQREPMILPLINRI